jgi:hypothetical protein
VIARPLGTSPGSQRSTESVRRSLPSPTSWRTTVATKVLVMLPMRKRSVARMGVFVFRFP